MHSLAWQATAGILCLCSVAIAQARSRNPYATQLAAECDALIASAVKRPYGWGWEAKPDGTAQSRRHSTVSMEPGDTPAAGLTLLWAGALLEQPRYIEAAVNAARGVAASQQATGQVLARPTFGTSTGGREAPSTTPERAATRASLALLLAVQGADESRDAQFTGNARRAASWLAKQQSKDGGWPMASPPDASPLDAVRLIRLDTPDFRDSTLALMLASDALSDKPAGKSAAKSVAKLVSLRLGNPSRLANLWSSAYRLNGEIDDAHSEFIPGADMLATRYALQTLLCASLMTRDSEARTTLDAAAQTIANLRGGDDLWRRVYPLDPLRNALPATTQAFFAPTTQPLIDIDAAGSFGLDALLESVHLLQTLGPDDYETRLREQVAPREQIALTLCGLWDAPMTLDWPNGTDEARSYLERHADLWRLLEGPAPTDLRPRISRLYILLLRARLERAFPDV